MPLDLSTLFLSSRRRLKYVIPPVVAVVVAGGFVLRPVSVVEHAVTAGIVQAEVMGTGTLAARVKVTLSPKIQGRLTEVLVDQNDRVRAGQLLAQLDDGELQQQVEIARATLAFARATADRVRADQDRAEAVVKLTRLDYQRSTELLAVSAVAQAEHDKALQGRRVAEADLLRTQLAITESERQIATAEKTLLYQQARLGDTRLLSPCDGLVVKRHRDAGEVVVPGSAIMEIVSTAELWIAAWVDETALAGLAPGQPARIVFRSEPDQPHAGEVARLGRQTDPETREFLVDVRLHALPANWTIGQRAEVYIATRPKPVAVLVPMPFLQLRDGQPGVFVAAGRHARWRPVQPGLRGRDTIEITAGLAAGEHVVVAREPRAPLQDGRRIAAP